MPKVHIYMHLLNEMTFQLTISIGEHFERGYSLCRLDFFRLAPDDVDDDRVAHCDDKGWYHKQCHSYEWDVQLKVRNHVDKGCSCLPLVTDSGTRPSWPSYCLSCNWSVNKLPQGVIEACDMCLNKSAHWDYILGSPPLSSPSFRQVLGERNLPCCINQKIIWNGLVVIVSDFKFCSTCNCNWSCVFCNCNCNWVYLV